jgi:hypothetical protein
MPLRAAVTRRSGFRALIFSLACVLLCVLSLKRAVERTPIDQESAGFKFSKTLQLASKKVGSIPVAAIRAEMLIPDPGIFESRVPPAARCYYYPVVNRPTSSRAPPFAVTV